MSIVKFLLDTSPRKFYHALYKRIIPQLSLSAFDDEHPCIFVLSTGRVGSMTLSYLLSYADNLKAVHEPKPMLYRASKAAYLSQYSIDSILLNEIFMCLRQEQIDSALSLGKGYVETSPQATFLAPVFMKIITHVKFIYLVRHPGEVIRSGMKRGWYAGHLADKNRITPLPGSHYYNQWQKMTLFQKNCWLWAETNRWIISFLDTIPADKAFTLHAEDLYSGQLNKLTALFEFCGSTLPCSRKINRVLSQKLNTQKRGEYPQPNKWSPEIIKELDVITGDIARELGYEIFYHE